MGAIADSRKLTAAEYHARADSFVPKIVSALIRFGVIGIPAIVAESYLVSSLVSDLPEILSEGMDVWDYTRLAGGLTLLPVIYVLTMNVLWPYEHYSDHKKSAQDWSDRADNADRLGL
jgi:hypothetical protein